MHANQQLTHMQSIKKEENKTNKERKKEIERTNERKKEKKNELEGILLPFKCHECEQKIQPNKVHIKILLMLLFISFLFFGKNRRELRYEVKKEMIMCVC